QNRKVHAQSLLETEGKTEILAKGTEAREEGEYGEQMVTIPLMMPLGTGVNEVKGLQFVMEEIS
ncbi:hypothetical protein STEG23_026018, partial [Scotinomys teguina]